MDLWSLSIKPKTFNYHSLKCSSIYTYNKNTAFKYVIRSLLADKNERFSGFPKIAEHHVVVVVAP